MKKLSNILIIMDFTTEHLEITKEVLKKIMAPLPKCIRHWANNIINQIIH